MGIQTNNTDHIIRSNIWTNQLKKVLEDDLMGMKYVSMLNDFPDGDTWNMVSIGGQEVQDYAEGQAIRYTGIDTGNLTMTITDYKAAGTFVTNKAKQDSFLMSQIISEFVPGQRRALMEGIEAAILDLGPNAQTASDLNLINNAPHRFVATGTNDVITLADFAKARYSLKKANVPDQNLVAIVDPSVEYTLNTLSNLTNVSNNPRWEGIIEQGIASGMSFVKNVFGFDVYVSNRLKSGISETINSNAVTNGVANLFFSAASDVLPFMGAIRQAPTVDSSYNKDLQRDEYVTTMRYGFKMKRPENMVVVISDSSQV